MPTLRLSLGHPTIVLALRELSKEDLTVAQLGPLLELKFRQSYRICEWLRLQQPRTICIKGWQHSYRGTAAAVYGTGTEDIPFIKLPKNLLKKRHELYKWATQLISESHRTTIPPQKLQMAYELLLVLRHSRSVRQIGLVPPEDDHPPPTGT